MASLYFIFIVFVFFLLWCEGGGGGAYRAVRAQKIPWVIIHRQEQEGWGDDQNQRTKAFDDQWRPKDKDIRYQGHNFLRVSLFFFFLV